MVAVGVDGAARGVLAVSDTVKATSAAAARLRRDSDSHPVLLTGDHRRRGHVVAAEVGIAT